MQKSIYNLYFQNTPKKGRRKSKQKVPIWRDSDNEEVWLVCTFVTCSSNNFAFDFWSSNVLHNSIKVMSFIQTHLVIIKKCLIIWWRQNTLWSTRQLMISFRSNQMTSDWPSWQDDIWQLLPSANSFKLFCKLFQNLIGSHSWKITHC